MKRTFQTIMLVLSVLLFCYTAFVAITYLFPEIVDFDDAFFFINMAAVPLSSLVVVAGSLICSRGCNVSPALRVISIVAILFFAIFILFFFLSIPFPFYWIIFQCQALILSVLLLAWVVTWIRLKRANSGSSLQQESKADGRHHPPRQKNLDNPSKAML